MEQHYKLMIERECYGTPHPHHSIRLKFTSQESLIDFLLNNIVDLHGLTNDISGRRYKFSVAIAVANDENMFGSFWYYYKWSEEKPFYYINAEELGYVKYIEKRDVFSLDEKLSKVLDECIDSLDLYHENF